MFTSVVMLVVGFAKCSRKCDRDRAVDGVLRDVVGKKLDQGVW